MAEHEPFGYQKSHATNDELNAKLDRVDELVSLLIDDAIEEDAFHELEALLEESAAARMHYVGMMQLHTDLMEHYNPRLVASASTPVLSQLPNSMDVTPTTPQHPAD